MTNPENRFRSTYIPGTNSVVTKGGGFLELPFDLPKETLIPVLSGADALEGLVTEWEGPDSPIGVAIIMPDQYRLSEEES